MNTETIVHVKPGHVAPEEYLALVSAKCPTVFGFAGREKDGKLVCESMTHIPTMTELKELNETLKDSHLLMFFANYPKAVLPDDIQPWSLNDGAEPPRHFLLMMFEGKFDKYADLNGDHTSAFNVSDEIVFPRLEKAFNDSDKDIAKFLESLRQSSIQRSLSNSFDGRGVFVFLGETGDPISFGTNDVGAEYEWGTVSNTHGYTKSVVQQVKQATSKGMSFLRGRSSTVAVSPPDTPAAPAPEPVVEPKKEVKPDSGPSEKIVDGVKLTRMFPPPKLHGKARNAWLRTFNHGSLPPDFESQGCCVWVQPDLVEFAKRSVSSKGEVENIASEIHNLRKKANNPVSEAMKTAAEAEAIEEAEAARHVLVGNGERKPITRSTTRERAPSANDHLAYMSDAEKEKAMNIMATYLDPKNEKRPSPAEIQAGETKRPHFTQTTGTKFEELLGFPTETLMKICDYNSTAVSIIKELRMRYIIDAKINLEELGSAKVEEKTEAPKPAAKAGGKLSFLRGKSAA